MTANVRSALKSALALVIGTVVALATAEIATRLFAPQLMTGSWFVYGPQGILMNKSGGVARQELPSRAVTYEFNSTNHRMREEVDPKAIRVLVLGDSFTFGIGLALEDTYVALLQRELDARAGPGRFQLLNAAAGGWGTADQLAYLEAFGPDLRLSAVVVFVSGDDFNRAVQRRIYMVDPSGDGLIVVDRSSENSVIKKFLQGNRLYEFLLEHSAFVQLLRRAAVFGGVGIVNRPADPQLTDEEDRRQKQLATLLFRRMRLWCQQHDIQLTVLTTGWPWVKYPWLERTLAEEGIFSRDLHGGVGAVMGSQRDAYEIPDDYHPNEKGAALIKAAAWAVLEQRLLSLLK
jgi:lysophospholipase L1-like esterase